MTASRLLAWLSLPAALLVVAAPEVAAEPPTGAAGFGARDHGMHHGAAGWYGMPC